MTHPPRGTWIVMAAAVALGIALVLAGVWSARGWLWD